MKTKSLALLLCGLLLVPAAVFAHNGEDHEAATINDAVAHYAAIGSALAADSMEGVADNAHDILAMMEAQSAEGGEYGEGMAEHHGEMAEHHEKMMGKDSEMMEHHEGMGMSPDQIAAMHTSMRKPLEILANKDTKLEQARDAYKALSLNFIPMAEKMYKKNEVDPDWAVMHCPMAKADWIQVDGKVANPFFGSKMLTCGKKVTDLASAEGMSGMHGAKMNGMEHEGHQMQGMSKEKQSGKHNGG